MEWHKMSTRANMEDLTIQLTMKTIAMVLKAFPQPLKKSARQCIGFPHFILQREKWKL
jgi:heterodisulfide reductase subunit B